MNNTWWVNANQLDSDQKKVIGAPLKESQLVLGPPGSGKSNLLLLRADYLERAGFPNTEIIVFTSQLQDFMRSGSENYSFDSGKIRTSRAWSLRLLREYDIYPDLPEGFEESREELCKLIDSLISERRLSNLYEYILLDEVQDYLPEEIESFLKLARYLIAVGDINQKIYGGSDGLSYLESKVESKYYLKHHYRNGLNICRLADGIAKSTDDYTLMADTSNYNEEEAPSSVSINTINDKDELINLLMQRLDVELKAYPNEFIGILTPRNEELEIISEAIKQTDFYKEGKVNLRDSGNPIDENSPIIVSSTHSAKGLEFRVLHLCYLEKVKRFPKQRNICYTSVTRAKTALYIYHIDGLPGYFDQAFANMNPPKAVPSIDDLFSKEDKK